MKETLESMIDDLKWLSENAGNWEYYLGKYDLCKELLSKYPDEPYIEFNYDDGYCNDYYDDELSMHIDDLEHYKEQEIEDMFDQRNRDFIWYLGKNVMNIDNLWFTSDEVDAFRIIWQRRISAM